jgi:O-antigen chain-terminating methyltransferase
MQNGHVDPRELIERVRDEVRKRKVRLEHQAPLVPLVSIGAAVAETPATAPVAAPSASPSEPLAPSLPPLAVSSSASPPVPRSEEGHSKPRLKHALVALERAGNKNEQGRGWPRFLRAIRRNQAAVNQSLIQGLRALIETGIWMREHFSLLDSRTTEQGRCAREQQAALAQLNQRQEESYRHAAEQMQRAEQLGQQLVALDSKLSKALERQHRQMSELDRNFEERRRLAAEQEQRIAEHQNQLIGLSYKLIEYQTATDARLNGAAAQQLQDKAQLLENQRAAREHEQELKGLRQFVAEQQKQTAEEQRQFEEYHKELERLMQLAVRFENEITLGRTQQSQHQQELNDLRRFVAEQQKQTAEEQRQFEEYHKELERLMQLAERFENEITLGRTQQSQHQQELNDLRRFVAEQQKQTAEEQRQFDENQKVLTRLTQLVERFENEITLGKTQQNQHQQELNDLRRFVAEQQKQTAEEQRQFDENQKVLTRLTQLVERFENEITLGKTQQNQHQQELNDLQHFVGEQQKQTAEEQRQFDKNEKELSAISANLIEYQNDAFARFHLTAERQEQLTIQLQDMQNFVNAQERQTTEENRILAEQQQQLTEIRASFEEYRAKSGHGAPALLADIAVVRDKVNSLQGSLAIVQAHLSKRKSPALSSPAARSLSEDLKEHEADAFYLAFENQFRGSRDEIKQRLRFYVPLLAEAKIATGHTSALDIGCGRGEWLELLLEQGYDGRGVDLNICMVEECRSRGLNAEGADAMGYLQNLDSGSLSVLTGFHIVEHLTFAQLLDLFRESFRVLRRDGKAIFETPNPECVKVPTYNFFFDPTHRNPIPQELLCFLGRQVGFGEVRVERLQPYFEDGTLKGYFDYAGIFTKR